MDIKELLTKWNKITEQEKIVKETKDMIKEEIGKIMHKKKINDLIETDDEKNNWSVKYQKSSRKNINYELLEEQISPDLFNDIVTITESTALVIRKTKQKSVKNKDVVNTSPNPDELDVKEEMFKKIPRGKINE